LNGKLAIEELFKKKQAELNKVHPNQCSQLSSLNQPIGWMAGL
jgi:hypothetical protein